MKSFANHVCIFNELRKGLLRKQAEVSFTILMYLISDS